MNRENSRVYKAVIIGGGASGLVVAIKLATKFGGENVLVIDRLSRVGKKLLSTGNGQCNILPLSNEITYFHTENPAVLSSVFSKYNGESVKNFFENLGIPFTLDGDKYYPLSKQASSVVDALRFKVSALNINVLLDSKVVSLSKKNHFEIGIENGDKFYGENVIVSAGGMAQKHLGTDGFSYSLLTGFGHSLTKLYPSIVQIKTETAKIKGFKGLKHKVNVSAYQGKNLLASASGDILFTDYGVSGNTAFYLSSYVSGLQNTSLSVDFCAELSLEKLTNLLALKIKNCPYLTGEHLLSGIIPGKIGSAILRNLGYDLSLSISAYTPDKIAFAVKNYTLLVTGVMGFDGAQVTKGGIPLSEFTNDLESKLCKNLYATGEILDVDGDCGGFNLKWAFCSALLVGDSVL